METKTKDNVFLTTVVSVQYQVIREKVYQAFYSLTDTRQQITAHVYDVLRSQLPTLELDAVFEAKEELALVRPSPGLVFFECHPFITLTRASFPATSRPPSRP